MAAAVGTSATISAGLTIGGDLTVAGNVKSNGKLVLTTADLSKINIVNVVNTTNVTNNIASPISWNTFNAIGIAGQTDFVLPSAPGPNSLVNVTRNGLNEVPVLHFTVANNILSFSSPCIGGEVIYAWWNA